MEGTFFNQVAEATAHGLAHHAQLVVIALSGFALERVAHLCQRAGASAWLVIPIKAAGWALLVIELLRVMRMAMH